VKGNELGVMVVGWSVESTVEIYFLPSSNSCLVYRVGSRYSSFPPLHRRNPGRGLFCYTGSTEPSLSAGRSHTELTIVWHLLRAYGNAPTLHFNTRRLRRAFGSGWYVERFRLGWAVFIILLFTAVYVCVFFFYFRCKHWFKVFSS